MRTGESLGWKRIGMGLGLALAVAWGATEAMATGHGLRRGGEVVVGPVETVLVEPSTYVVPSAFVVPATRTTVLPVSTVRYQLVPTSTRFVTEPVTTTYIASPTVLVAGQPIRNFFRRLAPTRYDRITTTSGVLVESGALMVAPTRFVETTTLVSPSTSVVVSEVVSDDVACCGGTAVVTYGAPIVSGETVVITESPSSSNVVTSTPTDRSRDRAARPATTMTPERRDRIANLPRPLNTPQVANDRRSVVAPVAPRIESTPATTSPARTTPPAESSPAPRAIPPVETLDDADLPPLPPADDTLLDPAPRLESPPPAAATDPIGEGDTVALPNNANKAAPAAPLPEPPARVDEGDPVEIPSLDLPPVAGSGTSRRQARKPVVMAILEGRVLNGESRSPESGVRVVLSDLERKQEDRVVQTDAQGRYLVKLPDGVWNLSARFDDGRTRNYGDFVVMDGVVTDANGKVYANVVLRR